MATSCGSVTIEPGFDAGDVAITSCGVDREQITEGESFALTYTVENNNDVEVHVEIDIRIGGSTQATGEHIVNPNSSESDTRSFGGSWGPGSYDVALELMTVSDQIPATLRAPSDGGLLNDWSPTADTGVLSGWSPSRGRQQRLFADGGQTIATSSTKDGCGCGCGGSCGGDGDSHDHDHDHDHTASTGSADNLSPFRSLR